MPGATTAGSDARFANLLEPIRDLAQNWSIDIASELEEYLGELEAITISFDELDGRTLNFVEAAMVIQGSACIYGKKVEHLHELVLQTLHQIVEKKKTKEARATDGDGGAADLDAAAEEDDNSSNPNPTPTPNPTPNPNPNPSRRTGGVRSSPATCTPATRRPSPNPNPNHQP